MSITSNSAYSVSTKNNLRIARTLHSIDKNVQTRVTCGENHVKKCSAFVFDEYCQFFYLLTVFGLSLPVSSVIPALLQS